VYNPEGEKNEPMFSKTVLALWFLLVVSTCRGQVTMNNDSSSSANPGPVSNIAWAKTHNAWHLSTLTASNIFASNGYVVATDSSDNGYLYSNYPTNTWTKITAWGAVKAIQYDGTGGHYALVVDTSCVSGAYRLKVWSGTAWVNRGNVCFSQLSTAADGGYQFLGIVNGQLWISYDYGYTWTQVAGNYLWAASVDSTLGLLTVVKSDHTVWSDYGGIWTQLAGISNATQAAIDASAHAYVLGTDSYVYRYNGGGWDKLAGNGVTSLSTSGPMSTWIVGPTQSGSNVWRFPDYAIQDIFTYTTHTTCLNQGVPSNCPSATHTPNGSFSFSGTHHNGGGTFQGAGGSPDSYLPLYMTDTMTDPFFCEEGGTECDVGGLAQTQCSILGQIFAVGVSSGLGNGGSGGFLDCLLRYPRPGLPIGWGQTHVTVYIESTDYPSGETAYTSLCTGISSWAPYNLNTYGCVSSHKPDFWHTSGSFIYVSKNTSGGAFNDPCVGTLGQTPNLCPMGRIVKNAWIHINSLATTAHDFLAQGAHEEGHDNFMDNCNWPTAPIDFPGPPAMRPGVCPRGTSVMSEDTLTASHLTAPSSCDITWYYLNQLR